MTTLTLQHLLTQHSAEPPIISLNRSVTLNQTGYIFYEITPMAQAFIDNEAKPEHQVIEIGSGFGNVPIEFLKRGIGKYIASDRDEQHLALLAKRIVQECGEDEHITFLHAQAPQGLPKVVNAYDAILIDKVLHFFTPPEIETFLQWAKIALKKGGRLYLNTISPYSKIYVDKMLPIYLEKVKNNIPYPGFVENSERVIDQNRVERDHPNHAVPKQLTLFALKELIELLQKYGFMVTDAHYIVLRDEQPPRWYVVDEAADTKLGLESLGMNGVCAHV